MTNTFRLAAFATAIAALSSASFAQTAQTVVINGISTTTYGSTGQVVVPGAPLPPSLASTVSALGSTNVSGLTAQPDIAAVGNFGLSQLNGVRATFVGLGATNTTELGTFDGGAITSGFRNNGVLGTNAILGDTAVAGNLSVSGTTSTNGINNNGQIISNVGSGVAASDASTVGQLNAATASTVAQLNAATAAQAITNANQATFNNQIVTQTEGNRRIASTGTAIVSAAASIPALEAGKTMGFGMGIGGYDGRSAISVALAARATQALQFKLHIGTGSGGKVAAGAGGMFSW